jgi:hypothetical protein
MSRHKGTAGITRLRGIVRTAVVSALITGSAMVALPTLASANVSGWSTDILPPTVSLSDNTMSFTADGAGNLYFPTSTGILKYNPSTSATSHLDAATNYSVADALVADTSGNIYLVMNSMVYTVSNTGVAGVLDSGPLSNSSGIAVDPSGNVYVADYVSGNGIIYKYSNGVKTTFASGIPFFIYGLSTDSSGNVYVTNYGSIVEKISPTGSVTPIGSGWSRAESVSVDGAGNVFVADEHATTVTEVSAAGVQSSLPIPPGGNAAPDEVFIGADGTLYLYDENSEGDRLYTYGVVPFGAADAPTNVAATSTPYTTEGLAFQSITATWTANPNATSYTCTLMYGFNVPSSFTVQTTTTSCTFGGLDPNTVFGIQVVANNRAAQSSPVVAFASLPTPPTTTTTVHHQHRNPYSILCVKGTAHRRIYALNPRCPAGWHRK